MVNNVMDGAHDFHNFHAKLLQPALLPTVIEYVRWTQAQARAAADGNAALPLPDAAPVSINLDLTTACNYRCDHCIDGDILNSGVKHDERELRDSLRWLARRGMRSVILIGGGEPTVYPRFVETVRFLKEELGQQVAVVSNGGRNDRILEAAPYFARGDWVRLSLDAGCDATFQAMHKPRRPITLEEICDWIPRIKDANPQLQVGYSFIVTWKGAHCDDAAIVENLDELATAAALAKHHRFDYLSVKPYLMRAEDNGAEVLDPTSADEELDGVIERIRRQVAAAKQLEDEHFKIVESTNLRLLEAKAWRRDARQPRTCHMQFFRQVLTPHGVFNCPGYRGNPNALIAPRNGYKDEETAAATKAKLGQFLQRFDASHECRHVTCLYHATNWWIQRLIDEPQVLETLEINATAEDTFL